MKHHEDIEGLFKRNEHKLEEMPSTDVWNRLEKKLDKPKPEKSPGIFRYLLVAASVMLLVAAIPLISNFMGREAMKEMAMATAMTPSYLEDLQTNSDASKDYYRVVEYQRKHRDRLSNPIVEGQKGRKLYVTKNLQDFSDVAMVEKPLPPKKKKTVRKENKLLENRVEAVSAKQDFNIEIGVESEQEIVAETTGSVFEGTEAAVVLEENIVMIEPVEVVETAVNVVRSTSAMSSSTTDGVAAPTEIMQEESAADMAVAEMMNVELAPEASSVSARKMDDAVGNNKVDYAKEATRNLDEVQVAGYNVKKKSRAATKETTREIDFLTSDAIASEMPQVISQFEWLIGGWEGNHKEGFSKETWIEINPTTLEGKAVFMLEGSVSFSETLRLEQIGEHIFYTMTINDSGKTARFILKDSTKDKAIFESVKYGASESLVLTKTASGKLVVELKFQESTLSDQGIKKYLEQRNTIRDNEVIRNLREEK